MSFLKLLLKENLEAEFFSISGSSFHIYAPHIPNGLQAILKTILVIAEYIATIRLSSKVLMNI